MHKIIFYLAALAVWIPIGLLLWKHYLKNDQDPTKTP